MSRVDYTGRVWEYIHSFGKSLLVYSAITAGLALAVGIAAVLTVSTFGVGTTAILVSSVSLATTAKALAITALGAATLGSTLVLTADFAEEAPAHIEYGKGHQGNMRDSGLIGVSDAEIEERLKDPRTPTAEKQRLIKEKKARGLRNVDKRKGYRHSK